MECNDYTYFSIGWNDRVNLRVEGNRYIHTIHDFNDDHFIVECDISEKSMLVINETQNVQLFIEYDRKYADNIDFDDSGTRWLGGVFCDNPYGYGQIFNENNSLIYEGFMINGVKVCYGITYYGDIHQKEYEGTFMNNQRHGFGKSFGRNKEYNGEHFWANDKCESFFVSIPDVFLDDSLIHNFVEVLIIGHNCYNWEGYSSIIIDSFHNLRSIEMGDLNFKEVLTFEIKNCNKLEVLTIGTDCFNKAQVYEGGVARDGSLLIHDCDSLNKISIGQYSFGDFSKAFVLESNSILSI